MQHNGTHDNTLMMLVEKYVNNTCSREELEQIIGLAKDRPEELFKALEFQWANANGATSFNEGRGDALFVSVMNEAKRIEPVADASLNDRGSRLTRSVGNSKLWKRLAAAAVLVLMISVAAFLLVRKNEPLQVVQNTSKPSIVNDVPPGGDKAVLTLADGRRIVLDTASNGALAQQGNSKVIKVGGQLTYDLESAATQEVFYNTITTPKGGQFQLELADGSKVWLNAASSLRFPTAFVGSDRTVELSGEAYFEVAHNPERPFHVKVNDMEVVVLGTHFNINSYSDEPMAKTTLLEGKVRVNKGEDYVYLSPGQQGVVSGNAAIRILSDIDVDQAVAWKNGLFIFDRSDLKKILRDLARWYDIEVQVDGDVTNKEFFGIVNRTSSLASVMKALKAGASSTINYRIEGKKLFVHPVRN